MSLAPSESETKLGPEAASFLSTEHWGLLATRSMIWNESFSRVSMFLTTLSASAVALALAADASGFGRSFRLFALVLFPIVLFLGVGAYLRICQIAIEDIYLTAAMNRLRHAYIDEVPELKRYLSTGWNDDERGVWKTFLLDQQQNQRTLQIFIATPTLIATIDAAVATAGGALALSHNGVSGGWLFALCAVIFLVTWVGLIAVQVGQFMKLSRDAKELSRFPSES